MYSKWVIFAARNSKEKATLEKALTPLLVADFRETGSIQSPSHVSNLGHLPPAPQSQFSQTLLGTRGSDSWQREENYSKKCWFHLTIKQNKHFPGSWIKVHCLTPARRHCSVPSCWGSRYFRRTQSSTSSYSIEFWLWQTALIESHHSMVTQLLAQNDTVILFWFLVHRTKATTVISPLEALCTLARSIDLCFYSAYQVVVGHYPYPIIYNNRWGRRLGN